MGKAVSPYKVPPQVSPQIKQATDILRNTIVANYNNIARAMIASAFKATGIKPKIGPDALIQLTEKYVIPVMQKAEGGWVDDPRDRGGPTMRGVILKTLRGTFDDLFINSNVTQVKQLAQTFNGLFNWKKDDAIGKQFLYTLCSESKIGALFIYKYMTTADARYPAVVMSEDPWLGFFFLESVWMTGSKVYKPFAPKVGGADFDGVLKSYGWNGNNSSFVKYIHSLGDKTAEVAGKVLLARYNHFIKLSQPGMKDAVHRKGWLNRLLYDNNSNLKMIVNLNEMFNLNSKGYFKFTQQEQEHLKRKGSVYKTFKVEIPG
jgi:hypothetical protein